MKYFSSYRDRVTLSDRNAFGLDEHNVDRLSCIKCYVRGDSSLPWKVQTLCTHQNRRLMVVPYPRTLFNLSTSEKRLLLAF